MGPWLVVGPRTVGKQYLPQPFNNARQFNGEIAWAGKRKMPQRNLIGSNRKAAVEVEGWLAVSLDAKDGSLHFVIPPCLAYYSVHACDKLHDGVVQL